MRTNGARAVGMTVMVVLAATGGVRAAGMIETFAEDPGTTGWYVMPGEDGSRFIYQAGTQTLLAKYNTIEPTARYVRPLGRTLTHEDSFSFYVGFTINSAGFFAHPDGFAQLAFGLLNTETTGPIRTDGITGDAWDVVSYDYFPNVSEDWGGPTLGATIIRSDIGATLGDAMDFDFSQETLLDDPGESPLPLDTPLTAEVKYDAAAGQATLRVKQGSGYLSINVVGNNGASGGEDADPTTIVTTLTPDAGGFAVNAFGFLLWEDVWGVWGQPGVPAVTADLVFDSIEVCWASFGDFDGDCDVDTEDVGLFKACSSGPAVTLADGCELFDANGDDDVDQEDFGQLQVMLTGPR